MDIEIGPTPGKECEKVISFPTAPIADGSPDNIDKSSFLQETNAINSKTKIKDRIAHIISNEGVFEFSGIEAETMQYNLSAVDGDLPEIVSVLESFNTRTF